VFSRHDLAELLIRLKQYDKAEKLLKQFLDSEQKGMFCVFFLNSDIESSVCFTFAPIEMSLLTLCRTFRFHKLYLDIII